MAQGLTNPVAAASEAAKFGTKLLTGGQRLHAKRDPDVEITLARAQTAP